MKYLKSNSFNVDAVYELLQVKSPAEHSKMKVHVIAQNAVSLVIRLDDLITSSGNSWILDGTLTTHVRCSAL